MMYTGTHGLPKTEHPQWRDTDFVASFFSIMEAPSPFAGFVVSFGAASLADAVRGALIFC